MDIRHWTSALVRSGRRREETEEAVDRSTDAHPHALPVVERRSDIEEEGQIRSSTAEHGRLASVGVEVDDVANPSAVTIYDPVMSIKRRFVAACVKESNASYDAPDERTKTSSR